MNASNAEKRKSYHGKGEGKSRGGAIGPGGEFVEFPEYEGDQEPRENRQAFTLFCKATRKEVKRSLSPPSRNNRDHVNSTLKDKWHALTDDERHVWKEWETWDAKRYSYQSKLYEQKKKSLSRVKKKAKIDGGLVLHGHQELKWNAMFDKLVEYKRAEGDTNVPQRYNEDPKLGTWVSQQRYKRRAGKIPDHRIAKLHSLNFNWEPKQAKVDSPPGVVLHEHQELKWNAMFDKLVEYKRAEGDTNVPQKYSEDPKLGKWVHQQRYKRRAGKVPAHRIARLDSLGFDWEPLKSGSANGKKWRAHFEKLKEFKKTYGHCLVPQSDPELGWWVAWLRMLRREGSLQGERERALNELGFAWCVAEAFWQGQCIKLKRYKEAHGDCIVPTRYEEDQQLSYWVRDQRCTFRKGTLSQGRIDSLNEIGFDWDPTEKIIDFCWTSQYEKLRALKEDCGHCIPPAGTPLHHWVHSQRIRRYNATRNGRRSLSQEQIDRLDEIGFVWKPRNFDEQWKTMYKKLKSYKLSHGDCLVPSNFEEDISLGLWVSNQRALKKRGEISPNRQEKLNKIGFVWQVLESTEHRDQTKNDERWQTQYEKLCLFRNENGHCRVTADTSLCNWVQLQRCLLRKNQLRSDRKDLLGEIGIVWSVDQESSRAMRWEAMYDCLVQFRNKTGHCKVPRGYEDERLVNWVARQRALFSRNGLHPDRTAKLDKIDFCWDASLAKVIA